MTPETADVVEAIKQQGDKQNASPLQMLVALLLPLLESHGRAVEPSRDGSPGTGILSDLQYLRQSYSDGKVPDSVLDAADRIMTLQWSALHHNTKVYAKAKGVPESEIVFPDLVRAAMALSEVIKSMTVVSERRAIEQTLQLEEFARRRADERKDRDPPGNT